MIVPIAMIGVVITRSKSGHGESHCVLRPVAGDARLVTAPDNQPVISAMVRTPCRGKTLPRTACCRLDGGWHPGGCTVDVDIDDVHATVRPSPAPDFDGLAGG